MHRKNADSHNAIAFQPTVVLAKNLVFWAEAFGHPQNPALLLIMGSGGQGILWPQPFCEQLARLGYFVIRYDNRDTGLSSAIDFQKNPYTLLDMAEDIHHILDHHNIEKAHIIGASMGGEIATIFAAHYPNRLKSLTLMITTPDMSAAMDAFLGKPTTSMLSKPSQEVLEAAKNMMTSPESLEEKIKAFIANARFNGGKAPIDETFYRQLALQVYARMTNPAGANNHFLAIQASYQIHQDALNKIKTPTLIIHGDVDPIFPLDHGHALNKIIPQSRLTIVADLGHGVSNPYFFDTFINEIHQHVSMRE